MDLLMASLRSGISRGGLHVLLHRNSSQLNRVLHYETRSVDPSPVAQRAASPTLARVNLSAQSEGTLHHVQVEIWRNLFYNFSI
jgi:hypothetical protein